MYHVMVDLETMGTSAGCAIVSIGAVRFDPEKGAIGSEFFRSIQLQSSLDSGLRVDGSTVIWWMQQSEEARKEIIIGTDLLAQSLMDFSRFFPEDGHLWGHGAYFDPPILEAAYRAVGVPLPWKFWNVRDTRTLFDVSRVYPERTKGIHHKALNDAKVQAEAVILAYRKLGRASFE